MLANDSKIFDHYAMTAEYATIPGALYSSIDLSNTIAKHLAAEGILPADFEFRLLGLEPEVRQQIANQDILAALNMGPPSNAPYLTGPLPVAIIKPPSDPSWQSILTPIDEEYHTLYSLRAIARKAGRGEALARSMWAQYTRHIAPKLYQRRLDVCNRDSVSNGPTFYQLGRIALQDTALLELYNRKKLPGHGSARQSLLRILLLENHPELGDEIDI